VQTESGSRRRRVPALAPDDRRAAIIAATLPLLREHGAAVTTRQIADAAGVAEGTIFGVFPDKPTLLVATMLDAFDPERARRALRDVDPAADLRTRLIAAVEVLVRRFADNASLFAVVRALPAGSAGTVLAQLGEGRKELLDAFVKVIEPDAAKLRQSPATAARLLLSLMFAGTRDQFGTGDRLTAEEIVTVLLDGLLVRPEEPGRPGGPATC
jgi:AcrR family transcriptional regulator